jgi:recyclin-1
MGHVLSALTEHGSRAVRVFPPPSQVLISFSERVAVDVVSTPPSLNVVASLSTSGRRIYHSATYPRTRIIQ